MRSPATGNAQRWQTIGEYAGNAHGSCVRPQDATAAGATAMTGWPANPVIYEVNTAVWLTSLSRAAGRRLTLAEVAGSDWETVTPAGVDAVWLMGVWQRSPAGLAVTRADAKAMASFQDLLPDL